MARPIFRRTAPVPLPKALPEKNRRRVQVPGVPVQIPVGRHIRRVGDPVPAFTPPPPPVVDDSDDGWVEINADEKFSLICRECGLSGSSVHFRLGGFNEQPQLRIRCDMCQEEHVEFL